MKTIIILVFFSFTLFTGCKHTRKITKQYGITYIDEGYVTVVGLAIEDNIEGALVESDSDHLFYFIEGLSTWPKNVHGKKVKAYGRCTVTDRHVLMERAPWKQGYIVFRTLKEAKWEVIE